MSNDRARATAETTDNTEESTHSSRPSLYSTASTVWRVLSRQEAKRRRELEALHLRFEALEQAVREAEKEEAIWRYLYDQVTGDKGTALTKNWSEEHRKEIELELLRTHGADRRLPGEPTEINKRWYGGIFWPMFRLFKEMPLRKVRRVDGDDAVQLFRGIKLMMDRAAKAHEEWAEAKKTDDYRRVENHDRELRLAVFRRLLAQVRGNKEEEKNALKDRDKAEKSRLEEIRRELLRGKNEPFISLERHLFGVKKKVETLQLKTDDLERKIRDLEKRIQEISDQNPLPQS